MGYVVVMSFKYYWDFVDYWFKFWIIGFGEVWYNSWIFKEFVKNEFFEINILVVGGNNDFKVYVDIFKGWIDYGKFIFLIYLKLNIIKYGFGEYVVYYDNSFSVIILKIVYVV